MKVYRDAPITSPEQSFRSDSALQGQLTCDRFNGGYLRQMVLDQRARL